MRVSDQTMSRILTDYIVRNREAAFTLQEQIASGQLIRVPSDNPNDYDSINRLNQSQSLLTQYARNAEQLRYELLNQDGTLQQVAGLLQRTSEIVVTGSNGTCPPEDRQNMAKEVNQALEDLLDLANSNPEGRYLFGGLRTDTAPYAIARDASGQIAAVTYRGNSEIRQVEVGKDAFIPANMPGTDTASSSAVFQSSEVDIIADLIRLRDRLATGENLVDPEVYTADPVTDTLTVANLYGTGAEVTVATTGTLPGGLDATRTYYAIQVSPTQIQLADSLAHARAGIAVDIASAGTGEQSITQQSLAEVTRDLEHITDTLATIGAREERLDACEKILSDWNLDIEESLDGLQSVDMAKALMELSEKKTAYEAALKAASTIMDQSLLNFI